jgi:hypothetical protein
MPQLPELRIGVLSDLAAIEQRIARSTSATNDLLDWSEKRYRHLVDNSLGLICTHDLDGTVLSVNPAAASSRVIRFLTPRAAQMPFGCWPNTRDPSTCS